MAEFWVGRRYEEIVGANNIDNAREFPKIQPKDVNHTVLFKVESPYRQPPEPFRTNPSLRWDYDHVRMPFDENSTYTVESEEGHPMTVPRWKLIEVALNRPMTTTDELIDVILTYNRKYGEGRYMWRFKALRQCIDSWAHKERDYFFNRTLKGIAERALQLKDLIQSPIPLLKQNQSRSISLSQEQISSILANGFFCTFPMRNSTDKKDEYNSYPKINFSRLYETGDVSDDVVAKLNCLINYFHRVTVKGPPKGVVTFVRRYVPHDRLPDWRNSTVPVKELLLHVDCTNSIQDAWGLIQTDFANKYLGGGVLGHGAVQEEIMFATSPDLMASMLFMEKLNDNEAVLIIGSEKYSNYTGYTRSFRFVGDKVDDTPFDSSGRRHRAVLAIDAKPYSNRAEEDNESNIRRELDKAYIGFSVFGNRSSGRNELSFPGVATGNWGCGAFGGSKSIKSLIQMMASVQAKRPLAYFTFHDRELMESIMNVYTMITDYNITVGQLYVYLVNNLTKAPDSRRNLRSFSRSIANSYKPPRRSPRHIALSDGEAKKDEESAARQKRSVRDDSNDSTGPDKVETSDAIIAELLNDSPDLFSPEEYQSTDVQTNKFESEHDQSTEPKNDSKMADEGDKMAGSKRTSRHTSRLFDEMQKIDDVNGKLNLPVSSPKTEKKAVFDDSPMDDDKTTESPEVKKKISGRKITDYFNKK